MYPTKPITSRLVFDMACNTVVLVYLVYAAITLLYEVASHGIVAMNGTTLYLFVGLAVGDQIARRKQYSIYGWTSRLHLIAGTYIFVVRYICYVLLWPIAGVIEVASNLIWGRPNGSVPW